MGKALEKWIGTWDERGFPPRLKAVVTAQLAERLVLVYCIFRSHLSLVISIVDYPRRYKGRAILSAFR